MFLGLLSNLRIPKWDHNKFQLVLLRLECGENPLGTVGRIAVFPEVTFGNGEGLHDFFETYSHNTGLCRCYLNVVSAKSTVGASSKTVRSERHAQVSLD